MRIREGEQLAMRGAGSLVTGVPLSCPLWSRSRNSFHQRLNDHGQSWTAENTSARCNLVITLVPFENYYDERMLAKIFITDLIKSPIKNETT